GLRRATPNCAGLRRWAPLHARKRARGANGQGWVSAAMVRRSSRLSTSMLGHHDRAHLLAEDRVRDPDDRDLADLGVARQCLLDLARVDVETTADHDVLLAVHNGDEPLGVLHAEVARAEPTVHNGLFGGLGPA